MATRRPVAFASQEGGIAAAFKHISDEILSRPNHILSDPVPLLNPRGKMRFVRLFKIWLPQDNNPKRRHAPLHSSVYLSTF